MYILLGRPALVAPARFETQREALQVVAEMLERDGEAAAASVALAYEIDGDRQLIAEGEILRRRVAAVIHGVLVGAGDVPPHPGEVARHVDAKAGITTLLIDPTATGVPNRNAVKIVEVPPHRTVYTYRWTTLCTAHDDLDRWSYREDAEDMLPLPEEWCSACRAAAAGRDEFGEPIEGVQSVEG